MKSQILEVLASIHITQCVGGQLLSYPWERDRSIPSLQLSVSPYTTPRPQHRRSSLALQFKMPLRVLEIIVLLAPADIILLIIFMHIICLTLALHIANQSPQISHETASTLIFIVACTVANIAIMVALFSPQLLDEPLFVVRYCFFCVGILMALIFMIVNKARRMWRIGTRYNFLRLYAELGRWARAGEVMKLE